MSLGADVWDVVETGYIKPVVLASKDDKLEFNFNAKAMNAILNGLAESEFVKVEVGASIVLVLEIIESWCSLQVGACNSEVATSFELVLKKR